MTRETKMSGRRLYGTVLVIALLACSAVAQRLVYQRTADFFNNRDLCYSGKLVPGTQQYVCTGPTNTTNTALPPNPAGTGMDFFAYAVNKITGLPMPHFGRNGLVTVDFGNVGGNSRTDVATELVMLTNPPRIALAGEAVTSKIGSATNLTFAIAMINAVDGSLVRNFGDNGLSLQDIAKGVNDEIFAADVDINNDMYFSGFANPGTQVGAGPAFDCAILKLDQYGKRVASFGQNGQVIIDYNGWDDRCRGAWPLRNAFGKIQTYTIAGRTRPVPGLNSTSGAPLPATNDHNNWRFAATAVDNEGAFVPVFTDNVNGFGRFALNMNNGSFEAIRSVGVGQWVYSVGNWGGWDNGVSGNKGVRIVRWNTQHGIDKSFVAYTTPAKFANVGSFDVYGISYDGLTSVYVSGGIKANAATAAVPQAVILKFDAITGALVTNFGFGGMFQPALPAGFIGSNYRSIIQDGPFTLMLSGEAIKSPGGLADLDVLVARVNLVF